MRAPGDLVLDDADGGEVPLAELWANGPVALIFLRHYG